MQRSIYLKWNENDHRINTVNNFRSYLANEAMVDVTLACDGLTLKAHKIVLSSCSTFFQSLFLENTSKHPIVVLKDVKYSELKAVIDFMYEGEIDVPQDQLASIIKTAQSLKVKVLGDVILDSVEIENHIIDVPSDQSNSDTVSSMPRSDLNNDSHENQAVSNQSSSLICRQTMNGLIPESEIKRSDSDIEDFCDDMNSTVRPSVVPLETHGTNSTCQSLEQPVKQVADASFTPESHKGFASSLNKQTFATDDDLQSTIQPTKELSYSFLATSTPVSSNAFAAVSQQLQNSCATSTVPLQTCNPNSSHESQLEQPIEQDGDENFEPEPDPGKSFTSEQRPVRKKSSVSTSMEKQPLAKVDAHSSQYKSSGKSNIESSRTNTENSSSYRVTLSASDVLIVHSQQAQGYCPKKIIRKKVDLVKPQEQPPSIRKDEVKKKRVRFTDEVQKIMHFSDDVKKTVRISEEVKKDDDYDSRQVLVKIGTNGSITRTEKFFRCKKCPFKTTYPLSLKRHVSSKHEKEKTFKCDKCSYEAPQKQQLAQHTAEVHENVLRFQCTFCPYKCAQQCHFKRHVESVHENKKPFKCDICGFQSAQKVTLRKHISAVHERKKDFACDYCAYRSAARDNVKRHERLIHKKKKSEKVPSTSNNSDSD